MPSRATASRIRCASTRRSARSQGANSQLSILLNSALRRVLGEATLTHVVRDERAQLMARVREQLDREAQAFGISVVDVRIRRADLPEQNSQAVYQRMQTERQREAAEFRAQGSQRAQEIRSRADRDVTVLVAEATSQVRADPRRGRRRAQPHLRRCLRQGSGFLRLLPLDAGLRGRACGTTTRAWCCSRIRSSSAISSIRRASRATARAAAAPAPARRGRGRAAAAASSERGRMSDFLVALGLVFAIEGLLFAAFPGAGQAGDGARAGDAGQRVATGRHRLGRDRRRAGLAGARVKRMRVRDGSLFRPNPALVIAMSTAALPLRPCRDADALSAQQLFLRRIDGHGPLAHRRLRAPSADRR